MSDPDSVITEINFSYEKSDPAISVGSILPECIFSKKERPFGKGIIVSLGF
jgi:hypothetical protein